MSTLSQDDLLIVQRPAPSSSAGTYKVTFADLFSSSNSKSTAPVHIGETAPVDPHEGDLWYQPSTDEFQIYFVEMTTGLVNGVSIRNGGSGYSVDQNLPTTSGSGHELFIDVTSIDGAGKITGIAVSQDGGGHGYEIDDVVFLFNDGHANGSVLINNVSSSPNGSWKSLGDAGEYA